MAGRRRGRDDVVAAAMELLDELPPEPGDRVREILRRYRAALLSRRDGARLVAGTEVIERNTLRVDEAIVSAMLDAGIEQSAAANTFWGLHYFVLGLVQEEQAEGDDGHAGFAETLRAGDHPALARLERALPASTFSERFEFGVDAFLRRAALA